MTAPPSAEERREAEKERQQEAVSRRLWTAVGGSEYYIKQNLVLVKEELANEGREASNINILQKLKSTPVIGMERARKQGARIDWQNPEWDGATLLLKAVRTDAMELAMYLLSLGADPLAVDLSGRSALHWAAVEGNPEMASYFLTNYPALDVNTADVAGDLPIHLAAFYGHLPVVGLLVGASADPQAPNGRGFTPMQLARARRMWHVAEFLETGDFKPHEEEKKGAEPQLELRNLMRSCDLERANELKREAEEEGKIKAKKK